VIQIVPYTPAWAEAFEAESKELRRVLGARAIRIEHVGSTAVPGLAAKPVIDIQVSVQSLEPPEEFQVALAPLGYKFVSNGDFDLEYPWFAKPGEWPSTHHVHLCVAGAEQEVLHLAFRDYLRKGKIQGRVRGPRLADRENEVHGRWRRVKVFGFGLAARKSLRQTSVAMPGRARGAGVASPFDFRRRAVLSVLRSTREAGRRTKLC
jgi:GrpB-like predicted nucleotidyltransferase (UPF0157 family)